ncbi:hypothetical protein TNCV_3655591 [Trichonephila clavipes]|nr:hypothetical protein TNCV_3655591 [Trichonephila clavipes]
MPSKEVCDTAIYLLDVAKITIQPLILDHSSLSEFGVGDRVKNKQSPKETTSVSSSMKEGASPYERCCIEMVV